MTFDESFAAISEALVGRTIEYVERCGKELRIRTTCSHEIKLLADVNGDIQYNGTAVKIFLPGLPMGVEQGKF